MNGGSVRIVPRPGTWVLPLPYLLHRTCSITKASRCFSQTTQAGSLFPPPLPSSLFLPPSPCSVLC